MLIKKIFQRNARQRNTTQRTTPIILSKHPLKLDGVYGFILNGWKPKRKEDEDRAREGEEEKDGGWWW